MNIKLTSMRWVLNFEMNSRLRSPDVRRSTFDVSSYFSLHDTVCRRWRPSNTAGLMDYKRSRLALAHLSIPQRENASMWSGTQSDATEMTLSEISIHVNNTAAAHKLLAWRSVRGLICRKGAKEHREKERSAEDLWQMQLKSDSRRHSKQNPVHSSELRQPWRPGKQTGNRLGRRLDSGRPQSGLSECRRRRILLWW